MSFEIDPEQVRAAGTGLVGVGDRLASALETLDARLKSFGEPWGGDSLGTLVGLSFPVVSGYLVQCYAAMADEYQSSGEDLVALAEDMTAVEEDLTGQFGALASKLS
ncbi:WXG100 family type VII secretion target [Micromonospora zamorensis]|uniref:WXG100 family type VII secretion target n=1 Tax=Micromonospora zamorensis TaxID=709883 RepID=UPI0037B0292E